MAFELVLAPEAVEDLRALKANVRARVRLALEVHLRHEPGKTSGPAVEILAIVAKSGAAAWLGRFGDPV